MVFNDDSKNIPRCIIKHKIKSRITFNEFLNYLTKIVSNEIYYKYKYIYIYILLVNLINIQYS